MDFLTPHRPKLYAVMRIATGFLFVFHGSHKLFGWPMAVLEGVPAFILCFVFLFIAAEGAGIWSIDGRGGDAA